MIVVVVFFSNLDTFLICKYFWINPTLQYKVHYVHCVFLFALNNLYLAKAVCRICDGMEILTSLCFLNLKSNVKYLVKTIPKAFILMFASFPKIRNKLSFISITDLIQNTDLSRSRSSWRATRVGIVDGGSPCGHLALPFRPWSNVCCYCCWGRC